MWVALVLIVTAYAPSAGGINCDADCAVTASGVPPAVGVAACPAEWPFGTKLYVPGYGPAECLDRGGAITGRHIDVVMETRAQALAWGRRELPVLVWTEKAAEKGGLGGSAGKEWNTEPDLIVPDAADDVKEGNERWMKSRKRRRSGPGSWCGFWCKVIR